MRERGLSEVFPFQFDRLAVRRTVRGMVPGVAIAGEARSIDDALLGNEAFERVEPMPIIGVAAIGVARLLRALDLLGQRRRPFRPGEKATATERQGHCKGLRLPGLVEYGSALVARQARHCGGEFLERRAVSIAGAIAHAGSR